MLCFQNDTFILVYEAVWNILQMKSHEETVLLNWFRKLLKDLRAFNRYLGDPVPLVRTVSADDSPPNDFDCEEKEDPDC